MKPVLNSIKLVVCPRSRICRNDHKFSSGKICGHHLPHPDTGLMCQSPNCGVETGTICTLIEEVEK